MSVNVDLSFAVILVLLAILGTSLIVGGIAVYRDTARANSRALGALLIGAGIIVWLFIIFITPTSVVQS